MKRIELTLPAVPPYDFDLTASYATYFKGAYGAESFENHTFRRLLDLDDGLCLASVSAVGKMDEPLLQMELLGHALPERCIAEATRQVSRILGLHQNLLPFYRMALREKKLSPLVKELKGLHVPQTPSIFEALILAILGQQISSEVARRLRSSLIRTFGARCSIENVLYYAFPRPGALSRAGVAKLRSIGLSLRKAEYILDIAESVTRRDLDLDMLSHLSNEEVIRSLCHMRGIGQWTANWTLIRALDRSDGFPATDLALLRAISRLLQMDVRNIPEETGRWSPFRGYVAVYLFAAIRSGRFQQLYGRSE